MFTRRAEPSAPVSTSTFMPFLRSEDVGVTSLEHSSNEARSILPEEPRLVSPGLVSDGRVVQQVLRELGRGKVPPARALLHCLEVVTRCSEPRRVVTKKSEAGVAGAAEQRPDTPCGVI